MTTVSELIKYLKALPRETTVEVVVSERGQYHDYASAVDLNLDTIDGNVEYLGPTETDQSSWLLLGES